MWEYNYTQDNNELCHYGVLGMKWGKRKAKTEYKSTSKKSALARKAKKQFKKDVRYARKHGLKGDYEYDTSTGKMRVTQWYNSKNKKIGEEYALKVLSEASKVNTSEKISPRKISRGKSYLKDAFGNDITKHTTGRHATLDVFDEDTGKKRGSNTLLESKYTEAQLEALEKKAEQAGKYRDIDVSKFRRR